MKIILRELIEDLTDIKIDGNRNVEVRGITSDSNIVEKDFLFACIPGFNFDGHAFIPQAIEKGACVLVVEKDIRPVEGVTVIKVPSTRYALGLLGSRFYGHPSSRLRVIGITGTNGKTTTSYMVKQILKEGGKKTALFGTIAYQLGNKILPASTTTPHSLELQSMFKELVEEGFDSVVMEVTSHALALYRVIGCEFGVGVFTNLGRDHLDFHKTMENYLEAKTELFRLLSLPFKGFNKKRAVINIDSPHAEHIIRNTKVKILTYGIEKEADIRAYDIKLCWKGLNFNVTTPIGKTAISLKLLGKYNVYNTLAAIGVGISEGISLDEIKRAMAGLEDIQGRFEQVDCGQPFNVVIDYAHTPDALKEVLRAARELTAKRVLTLFGCGGDRDKTKRPLMGEVAAAYSDIIVLTSDNPRSEDPLKIIKEIETGIKRSDFPKDKYLIIENRLEAIDKALTMAGEGDLVIIAGKGHEDYQIIKDKRIFFSDREAVKKLLKGLTAR